MSRTPLFLLLDERLPGGLAFYVGRCRGQGKSWRTIAQEIVDLTGIDVSHERLRLWFEENGAAA